MRWTIVEYAQVSTRDEAITNEMHARLRLHFTEQQIIEICFPIALSNTINRFHATFLTEVDQRTKEALAPSCPFRIPTSNRTTSSSKPLPLSGGLLLGQ